MEVLNSHHRDDAVNAPTSEAACIEGYRDGDKVEAISTTEPCQLFSLATSLPAELIEMVLSNFSLSEVNVAAAHLPQLWRSVIENSVHIRKKLRALHYFDDSRSNGCMRPGFPFWFSSSLEFGILFVWHITPSREGIIFAPYSRARLCILDPTTKVVEHRKTSDGHGSESVVFFDLEGNLVCQRGVNDNNVDALWRYATKV